MLYLVSDTHFNEDPTISSFYGPDFFSSSEAYMTYTTRRWKDKIKRDDTVIVVGDAGDPYVFNDLPGHKILVRGNHDIYNTDLYSAFDKVVNHIYLEESGVRILVEHILGSSNIEADIVICGHSHQVVCYRYLYDNKTIIYALINLLGYEPRTLQELLDSTYHNWLYDLLKIREIIINDTTWE